MLEVKRLSKDFGGIVAVNNCSFKVDDRSITGLIGPNGAGKTTVFNLITGFYPPTSGRITFNANRIDGLLPHQVATKGIGRTFQLVRLFPKMTVLENLLCASRNPVGERAFAALLNLGKAKRQEESNIKRCGNILDIVGLKGMGGETASELSFGDMKLLEIARVLALDPRLILLDEPMAGVDPAMKRKLVALIRELREKGKTFLIIEHDMRTIMNICDMVVVLVYGKEIAYGTPSEIQANPRVIEAYLGVKG